MYAFTIDFVLQALNLDVVPHSLYNTRAALLLDAQHRAKVGVHLVLLRLMLEVDHYADLGLRVAGPAHRETV